MIELNQILIRSNSVKNKHYNRYCCYTLFWCVFIMKIVSGFQDTRKNKEDFAITPYLFGVWVREEIIKVYGIGLCWGFYSIYIGIGFNIPKGYGGFRVLP